MAILNGIEEAIGHTPLVRLDSASATQAEVLVKLEYQNPGGSVKDRLALGVIEDAERKGLLSTGQTIVEATSGNTGIGLAMIAAARGYRCVLTMPDSMSVERRKILQAYGVELILTPAAEGMRGAIAKADEIQKERGGFKPLQFDNPANPEMHYRTTGPEIWEDTEGQLDAFVAGIGTGGTFMGVTRFLKERRKVHCVVVEPEASAIFSGGQSGPHKIQGIGPGFVPKVVHPEVFDEVIAVALEDALGTSRELARGHGMLSGISAGANVFAARQVASALAASNGTGEGLRVVTVIPSNGERYLSTVLFNDPE